MCPAPCHILEMYEGHTEQDKMYSVIHFYRKTNWQITVHKKAHKNVREIVLHLLRENSGESGSNRNFNISPNKLITLEEIANDSALSLLSTHLKIILDVIDLDLYI